MFTVNIIFTLVLHMQSTIRTASICHLYISSSLLQLNKTISSNLSEAIMNLSIFEEIYAPVFSSPPRGADQSNPWVKKTLFSTEFLSKPSKDFIGRRGFLVGKDAMDAGVFAAKVQIRAAFKKVVNGLVVFEFFDMLLLRFVFQKNDVYVQFPGK